MASAWEAADGGRSMLRRRKIARKPHTARWKIARNPLRADPYVPNFARENRGPTGNRGTGAFMRDIVNPRNGARSLLFADTMMEAVHDRMSISYPRLSPSRSRFCMGLVLFAYKHPLPWRASHCDLFPIKPDI